MKPYRKPELSKLINKSLPKQFLDLSPKQFENLKNVSEIVLGVISVLGLTTISIVAPNSLKLLKNFSWTKRSYKQNWPGSKNRRHQITQTFYYLKRHNYIKLEPKGEDFLVKITRKGKKKIFQMNLSSVQIKKPPVWNKLWWLVLADVPTKDYKTKADLFRKKLKKMKFYPLQRSVWAYPFDPREEIAFVAAHYNIERFVTTIEAKTLDPQDEKLLKGYFKKRAFSENDRQFPAIS